jgi:hypothetical protein
VSKKREIYGKGRVQGQFVMVRHELLDSAAWKHLSFGARALYTALVRYVDFKSYNNGKVFLSLRKAAEILGATRKSAGIWFIELQHYGFLVETEPGTLGPHGKATRWRITDRAWGNLDGKPVEATKDYLNWTGELFDRRLLNPISQGRLFTPTKRKKYARGEPGKTTATSDVKNTPEGEPVQRGKKYARSRYTISQAERSPMAALKEWTTPKLEEIEYTKELRRLYRCEVVGEAEPNGAEPVFVDVDAIVQQALETMEVKGNA